LLGAGIIHGPGQRRNLLRHKEGRRVRFFGRIGLEEAAAGAAVGFYKAALAAPSTVASVGLPLEPAGLGRPLDPPLDQDRTAIAIK